MIKYNKINDANNFLRRFGLELSVKTGGENKIEEPLFINKEPNNMWSVKFKKNNIYFMDSSNLNCFTLTSFTSN